ncbi:MAG: hypothetical protein IT317_03060 [Anaerolineales bacterium]|nr:hypothetical protein [Anaerolineales bacterium]
MTENEYRIGNLVVVVAGEWQGHAGVVSWPITPQEAGHVLVLSDGRIAGPRLSHAEVRLADAATRGYSQLAHGLIKLSSFLIERAILPLAR